MIVFGPVRVDAGVLLIGMLLAVPFLGGLTVLLALPKPLAALTGRRQR